MKNLRISLKLIISFSIVIGLFVIVSVYQLNELNALGKLQDEGAVRSNALVYAKESGAMGYKLYQVVADAIINRDLSNAQSQWNEVKADANEDFAYLEKVVDTNIERELLKKGKEHIDELIGIYENEMLPLLKNEDVTMEEIRVVDAKLDQVIKELQNPMNQLIASIEAENLAADQLFDETVSTEFVVIIVIVIIAIIVSIIFTIMLVNLIAKPLIRGVNFAKEIAEGNLLVELKVDQKDEVGVLAEALQEMVNKLKEIIGNVITGADNIASASQQMSSTSQELSQGANEQASSVEEVSSTMEQMTSNIEQNSQNAMQTEKISMVAYEGMADVSQRSGLAVDANRTIADKIKIINDIAFQTNILALNAAVEAARAGEYGRGFAVVAAEVRKLAERSKVAADEIVGLSNKSLEYTEGAGKKLNELMPEIEKTTRMVQEISAASAEQTNGTAQINSAVQQLNSVTQQNAAASEELSTGAEELASQAEQLKELVSFFKVEREKNKNLYTRAEKSRKVETQHHNPDHGKSKIKSSGIKLHLKDGDDNSFERF
ncbi:MAG: methyl-accepting chemotaxis protein [Tenuifilaceae bacterium]